MKTTRLPLPRRPAQAGRWVLIAASALVAAACGGGTGPSATARPSQPATAGSAVATPAGGSSASSSPAPSPTPSVPGTPAPLSELSDLGAPGPLHDFAVGYDPVTQRLILQGGSSTPSAQPASADTFSAATWAWDGKTWTQLSPVAELPPQSDGSMAVDPVSGHLMYVGGSAWTIDASGDFVWDANEGTWLWNGSSWARVADNPEQGAYPATAVDQATQQLVANCPSVLTGSGPMATPPAWYTSYGFYRWTGTGWVQAPTDGTGDSQYNTPEYMLAIQAAIAYDPISQRVIEFGGGQQYAFNGTIGYDGTAWKTLIPPPDATDSPGTPPGGYALAATDEKAGEIILLANSSSATLSATNTATTWTWTGDGWEQLTVAGEPLAAVVSEGYGQMVWDPAIQGVVLVDWTGSGDLQVWVWQGTPVGWTQLSS